MGIGLKINSCVKDFSICVSLEKASSVFDTMKVIQLGRLASKREMPMPTHSFY